MATVVVRIGYNVPELGVLIREGPKTLIVAPLYSWSVHQMIADIPNRKNGERWQRTSCALLDPSIPADMAKIEIVMQLIREEQDLRALIDGKRAAYRVAYKARLAEVFGPEVA